MLEKEYEEDWKWQMEEVKAALERIETGKTIGTKHLTYKELKEEFGNTPCIFCDCSIFMRDPFEEEEENKYYCHVCGRVELEHLQVMNEMFN